MNICIGVYSTYDTMLSAIDSLPSRQFNWTQIQLILQCQASLDPTRVSFHSELVQTKTGTTTCQLRIQSNDDYVALVLLSDFNGMGAAIKSHPFKSGGRITIAHVSLTYSPQNMSPRIPQDMRRFTTFTGNDRHTIERCIAHIVNADGTLSRHNIANVTVTCMNSPRSVSAGQPSRPHYIAQVIREHGSYKTALNSGQYADMAECSVEQVAVTYQLPAEVQAAAPGVVRHSAPPRSAASASLPVFTNFSERQIRRILDVAAQCFSMKRTATKAYPADPNHTNISSVRVRFSRTDRMYVATVRLNDGMYELQSEPYADYTAVPKFARCINFAP